MSKKAKENKTELVPALEPRVPNRAYTEMKSQQQNNCKNKTESKNCNK